VARYGPNGTSGCIAITGQSFCAGDGSGGACPCGNVGASGRGCESSASTGGAQLEANGHSNLGTDDVTLRVSGTPPSTTLLFFQGTTAVNAGVGIAFGDGLRCVAGQQIRLAIRVASAGSASFGANVPGDPRVSIAGQVSAPESRRYQAWYRDAQSFCTASTFNLSNGLMLRWAP
jgi:hypothetical protein